MFGEDPLSAKVPLTHSGTQTRRQPDQLRLVFDQPLLRSMAKALAVLAAFNEERVQLTLPLGDRLAFSEKDQPWSLKQRGKRRFLVSGTWLQIRPQGLHIEVWQFYGDDMLHGEIDFAKTPDVRAAAECYLRWAEEDLLLGLCAARRDSAVTIPALVRALRR